MKSPIAGFVGAVALLTAIAIPALGSAPAFACHEHTLYTPGHTVVDIASGQTSRQLGEGGYHQFHKHVHKGVPGDNINDIGANDDGAFQNPNNPVSVVGAPFAAICP